ITPCAEHDLGPDLLARLAKKRVLNVDPFASVLALFGAEVLDPALARPDDRWLVDELIKIAPPGGYSNQPLVGGVLDIDTAWAAWHDARLAGAAVPATLEEVLATVSEPAVTHALADLDATQRPRLAARWAGGAAPVDVIVELVACGRGGDVVAIGLVAGALWEATDDAGLAAQQTAGRIRLEGALGRDHLTRESAAAWARASTAHVGDDDSLHYHFDRAESVLAAESVRELAALSDSLPLGYDLRLERVAQIVAASDVAGAEAALAWLRRHRLAAKRPWRTETASAAVRVLRRVSPASTGGSFAELVADYSRDGSWLDAARRLLAAGDNLPAVSGTYAALCRRIDDERRTGDIAFGRALADWSAHEPAAAATFVPVERILDEVVVSAARAAPVLLIVADGMSLTVANTLVGKLPGEGWSLAVPDGRVAWPTGVAMLPTVTEVSRASLLAGARIDGRQREEREGFAAHAGLRAASSATRPPVLLHKRELDGPAGWMLPSDVQEQIADADQRVVGVVVNAVDDHLSRGQQVQVEWDLETLRPLGALLDAARDAGRLVVLTADHGHVLHGEGAVLRPVASAGGERYRTMPPPPADDELEFAGPRVLKGGRVVLPVDDRLRYNGTKHGYHGGATPQEVLVPVVVLARTPPIGWRHVPQAVPAWWSGSEAPGGGAPPAVPPVAAPRTTRPGEPPSLFEQEAPPVDVPASTVSWVESFVTSPAFVARQKPLPRPLPAERVARYLDAIRGNGGTIPLSALAERLGEPKDQLRMALTLVQRLLNVDGAEILAIRSDESVVLNSELLALQFEVDVP
ncbi:MAG: BREX-2 system phosphatase PglZ, partial [Acidimicrobiales bacterium]